MYSFWFFVYLIEACIINGYVCVRADLELADGYCVRYIITDAKGHSSHLN